MHCLLSPLHTAVWLSRFLSPVVCFVIVGAGELGWTPSPLPDAFPPLSLTLSLSLSTLSLSLSALVDFYLSTNGQVWFNNSHWLNGDPCEQEWFGVSWYDGGHEIFSPILRTRWGGYDHFSSSRRSSLEESQSNGRRSFLALEYLYFPLPLPPSLSLSPSPSLPLPLSHSLTFSLSTLKVPLSEWPEWDPAREHWEYHGLTIFVLFARFAPRSLCDAF